MPKVEVKKYENIDRALRRFKRACEKAGVFTDSRKHEFYEKPSERKKRAKAAAIKRQKRSLEKQQTARRKLY